MLSRLRRLDGNPAARVRVLAALVVAGLLVATAPLVVLPVMHWFAAHL